MNKVESKWGYYKWLLSEYLYSRAESTNHRVSDPGIGSDSGD